MAELPEANIDLSPPSQATDEHLPLIHQIMSSAKSVEAKPAAAAPEVKLDQVKPETAIKGGGDLDAARKTLNADIDQCEKGLSKKSEEFANLELMRKNMAVLEKRAAAEHPPLKASDIAETYRAVSRLIETKDGAGVPVKSSDRINLAGQILHHVADPTNIDQGDHETCSVTTVETRMFTKNPAAAADLIAQVATTGAYQPEGQPQAKIKIDGESLKPNSHEEKARIPKDGERSFASQLFQVTAVNAYYKTHDLTVKDQYDKPMDTYPKGTVEYRQEKADKHATPPHTGEALYDMSSKPPVAIQDWSGAAIHTPYMNIGMVTDTYNLISGKKEDGYVFVNKDYGALADGTVSWFTSQDELRSKIVEAQKAGKLPIILNCYSGLEPFYSDSKGGSAGGAGGGHVVTVNGLDDQGRVIVNNQWGKQSKHPVELHELFLATSMPANVIADLSKECARNAAEHMKNPEHKMDFAKEAEVIRLKHALSDDPDSNEIYREQLLWITRQAVDDAVAHHEGKLDRRTEIELQSQLVREFAKNGFDSPDWQRLTSQVWNIPLTGIMKGTGEVTRTAYGYKWTPPSEYSTFNAAMTARDIYSAGDATFYFDQDDYAKLNRSLEHRTPAQMMQIDQQFKRKYGKTIEDYINDRFSNHAAERDQALKLLHQAQSGTQP